MLTNLLYQNGKISKSVKFVVLQTNAGAILQDFFQFTCFQITEVRRDKTFLSIRKLTKTKTTNLALRQCLFTLDVIIERTSKSYPGRFFFDHMIDMVIAIAAKPKIPTEPNMAGKRISWA